MRKLILIMSVSLDGFVAGINGELDWIFTTGGKDAADWKLNAIRQAGAHLMGRHTFNIMKAYWPDSTDQFAEPMNTIPKITFSRSAINGLPKTSSAVTDEDRPGSDSDLQDLAITEAADSWNNATILSGDLATEINRLKVLPGKDLVAHGGARFAQSLASLNLIDVYKLLIHPVALGQGMPLFSALTTPLYLELKNVVVFDKGTVAHEFEPADQF